MHYGARWYDPVIGRFISPDTFTPSVTDSELLNRYAYARNNPARYIDPTGHQSIPISPIPPIWDAVSRFFGHPYIKPLWQNPQIGAPVVYADYRRARGDAPEALELTSDWYWERGDAPRFIDDSGGDSEIIDFLISSEGLQQAREEFRRRGGEDMIGIGEGAYEHEFDIEYFTETSKAVLQDDWSGSFLGGYYVEFRNLEDWRSGGRLVEVAVINDTGWASGTRIPFTSLSYRQNEDRALPGPGGTLWQYYRWKEIIYLNE